MNAAPILMAHSQCLEIASRVLFAEARFLDRQEWKEWLALYVEEAVYWIPAWKNEYETTSDPDRELSMIYHTSSVALAERIARIQSRKSITAMPLPRTVHCYSNLAAASAAPDAIEGDGCVTVHVFDPRTARQHLNFGRFDYRLNRTGDRWQFAFKKIVLFNDRVNTLLDFYSI